jgi:hypothetical protein
MLRRLSAAMLVVQFFGLSAQDRLTAVSETVTGVQSETRGTFSDLVQLPLDVTGVDAVLVMASIETRYGDAVNSREGIYRMTDGNGVSETVWQTLRKSGARDKQIGTLVHIFDASGLSGPVTYHLQHTSRVSKPVISSATLVAVALTTTETGYTLSFGQRRITAPVYTSGTINNWAAVNGLATGRIQLAAEGDIFLSASINSVSDEPAAAEWKLQYSPDQSAWSDLGTVSRRSLTSDEEYGISSLFWIARDLPAGDHYVRVVHRQTEGTPGDVRTLNSSLVACALLYQDGPGSTREFPSFTLQNNSSSTAATSMTPVITQPVDPLYPTNLFLQAQFAAGANDIADAPAYDLHIDQAILEGTDLQQFLPTPTEVASGGSVGLGRSLQPGTLYNASLRHQSVPGVTLNTSRATLTGFQLTSVGDCVWTGDGSTPTSWENSDNWAGAAPGTRDNVLIPDGLTHYPVLVAPTSCQNLVIEAGASLELDPVSSLTIHGSLEAPGSMSVRADGTGTGSLIAKSGVSGSITFQNHLTADRWHIVSPPLSGQSIGAFLENGENNIPSSPDGFYGLTDYDELTNGWNDFFYPGGSGDFVTGAGYLLRRADSDGQVTYEGTVTAGDVEFPVTAMGEGWNAVGNPFTSAIGVTSDASTAENFLTRNLPQLDPNYGVLYVWEEEPGYSGTQNNYKVIGNAGYVYPGNHPELDQDYLQAGQGFLVKSAPGGGSLTFSRDMQAHQNSLTFLKSTPVSWDGFRLVVESAEHSATTTVCFHDQMTLGLDPSYDAGLLNSNPEFSVYTRLAEGDRGIPFKIQSLPSLWNSDLMIPVGVEFNNGGEIGFSAEGILLPETHKILLEDRELDYWIDLTGEGSHYRLFLEPGTICSDRFFLHIRNTESISGNAGPIMEHSLRAWYHHQSLVISGFLNQGTVVSLYDLQGRLIGTHLLEEGTFHQIPQSIIDKGIYLLTIHHGSTRRTLKILKSD